MRTMAAGILMVAGMARADVMDLHDGDGTGMGSRQYAVTQQYYNAAAWLKWKNPGGDWIDAQGVEQGTAPFHRLDGSFVAGSEVDVEVTRVLSADGITLRKLSGRHLVFASRESDTPPRLKVTYADGSHSEHLPAADSTITSGSELGQGRRLTLDPAQSVVMRFPRIDGAVKSAFIRFRVTASGGGLSSLGVFAMKAPRTPPGEAGTGYAEQYPGDKGIEKDPRTLYAEGWEDPANWWKKVGYSNATPTPQWTKDGNLPKPTTWAGMWLANGGPDVPAQCTGVPVPRGTGFHGNGLMGVHCTDKLAVGINVPSVNLKALTGAELDEAWARYYIKYGASHMYFDKCEGGKAPGFAGNTDVAGNSGMPGWGLRGWSMRHEFQFVCDPENPAHGRIVFGVYAYHGDVLNAFFGGMWNGQEHTLLESDRWYCIEQHIKVNTPGVNDGIVESFIDGRLVVRKTDVLLRSVKPAQGYGLWEMDKGSTPAQAGAPVHTDHRNLRFWLRGKIVDTELGIEKFWGMVHGGGRTPTGKNGQMWYDQTVVARERVGCMAPALPEAAKPAQKKAR